MISAVIPVSSWHSRMAQAAAVSPISIAPPRNAHCPVSRRYRSSIAPESSVTSRSRATDQRIGFGCSRVVVVLGPARDRPFVRVTESVRQPPMTNERNAPGDARDRNGARRGRAVARAGYQVMWMASAAMSSGPPCGAMDARIVSRNRSGSVAGVSAAR